MAHLNVTEIFFVSLLKIGCSMYRNISTGPRMEPIYTSSYLTIEEFV